MKVNRNLEQFLTQLFNQHEVRDSKIYNQTDIQNTG